jgi:hypothetical protein
MSIEDWRDPLQKLGMRPMYRTLLEPEGRAGDQFSTGATVNSQSALTPRFQSHFGSMIESPG